MNFRNVLNKQSRIVRHAAHPYLHPEAPASNLQEDQQPKVSTTTTFFTRRKYPFTASDRFRDSMVSQSLYNTGLQKQRFVMPENLLAGPSHGFLKNLTSKPVAFKDRRWSLEPQKHLKADLLGDGRGRAGYRLKTHELY